MSRIEHPEVVIWSLNYDELVAPSFRTSSSPLPISCFDGLIIAAMSRVCEFLGPIASQESLNKGSDSG